MYFLGVLNGFLEALLIVGGSIFGVVIFVFTISIFIGLSLSFILLYFLIVVRVFIFCEKIILVVFYEKELN